MRIPFKAKKKSVRGDVHAFRPVNDTPSVNRKTRKSVFSLSRKRVRQNLDAK